MSFRLEPLPLPASIELETPAVLRQCGREGSASLRSRFEGRIFYILRAVEETAKETLTQVTGIRQLMQETKQRLRTRHPKLYRQELLNNLFRHPYTKVEFIEHDLSVSRPTATKYLDTLHTAGFAKKTKLGRTNFYIDEPLFALLGR